MIVKEFGLDYSQRDNTIDPFSSCWSTSEVAIITFKGVLPLKDTEKWPTEYIQPEDALYQYIYKNSGMKTYQSHDNACKWTSKWIGYPVTFNVIKLSPNALNDQLKQYGPVMISGSFPGYPVRYEKPLGHMVVCYGVDNSFVYLMDPYGDTMNDWRGSGGKVKVPLEFAFGSKDISRPYKGWFNKDNNLWVIRTEV